MPQAVFRFAPSPTGRLHLGHACSALLNDRLARATGGRFLLRIEDIDAARCREEHVAAILDDLAWLGLSWEEPVRRQSRHLGDYEVAGGALRARRLLYPCFCSRSEIARDAAAAALALGRDVARDPDGAPLYPGTCRVLGEREIAARTAAGRRPAKRLDTARALAETRSLGWTRFDEVFATSPVPARPERWGDPVVVRRDIGTSYHLAVVVDDALQGVTHVVRGRDLEAATDIHRLLQALLGLPSPLYHHHALIADAAGEKLAKSAGAPALAALREAGETAAAVRGRLGFGALSR